MRTNQQYIDEVKTLADDINQSLREFTYFGDEEWDESLSDEIKSKVKLLRQTLIEIDNVPSNDDFVAIHQGFSCFEPDYFQTVTITQSLPKQVCNASTPSRSEVIKQAIDNPFPNPFIEFQSKCFSLRLNHQRKFNDIPSEKE